MPGEEVAVGAAATAISTLDLAKLGAMGVITLAILAGFIFLADRYLKILDKNMTVGLAHMEKLVEQDLQGLEAIRAFVEATQSGNTTRETAIEGMSQDMNARIEESGRDIVRAIDRLAEKQSVLAAAVQEQAAQLKEALERQRLEVNVQGTN